MPAINPHLVFVIGGARSGKSSFAEARIRTAPAPWTYVATAEALDDEMAERIARHRAQRGAGWVDVEAPHSLASAVATAHANAPLLVDCLTLWVSNRMLAGADLLRERNELVAAIARRRALTLVVSNEVGLGVVPDNALARRFRDEAGFLHQAVAAHAAEVHLMVAGLSVRAR
ncbi:MAG: bifunctional adenosylcobinamide kinase/adenosylcobinamide-phosphate guanylyltransferase [Hyphomicrobiales bacterium]|nr:bifunctional adenosylcobinamide kinase/adenosylcobinamide-phosphate guanylyltransferase [Hyphomicrobiales bacterium]